MPTWQFEMLDAHRESIWAEEVLKQRGGSLKAKELKMLVLLATGDRDQADSEYSQRLLEEMKHNPEATPDV
jgi:hypothetical protein